MALPNLFGSMSAALQEMQTTAILQTNEVSARYGLTLTAEEAAEIVEARDEVLRGYGRVELEIEVTRKLILAFCSSPYMDEDEYASTLIDLQEVFYYMKNETEDQIGDDELIEIIHDYYENSCGGSIELLMGRELDEFARSFRRQRQAGLWRGDDF